MAHSEYSTDNRRIVIRQNHYWPEPRLICWLIFMMVAGILQTYIYGRLSTQQSLLGLNSPWIIPYGITTGIITLFFVWIMLAMMFARRLMPNIVLIKAFTLLVLYIVGIIGTAIQLCGSLGKVCHGDVLSKTPTGVSNDTLSWLLNFQICHDWIIVLIFWIVGAIMLVWMMVGARQVATGK